MAEIKEFVEALEPIGKRIDNVAASVEATDKKLDGVVQRTEDWMRDAEEKFSKARHGFSVTDNLKAALPQRFHRTISDFARTGDKDPVKSAAMEAWLKNHLKMQLPHYSRDMSRLAEENARLAEAMGEEKAYLNESTASQGANAVPTIVESELFRIIEDNSLVRQTARKMVINTKTTTLVNLASNVTAYVIAELGGAITAGEPTLGSAALTAKDFCAYGQATLDVLQDEVVGLLNFFMVNAGEMIGQKEDSLALMGTSGDAFTGLAGQTTTNTFTIGKIYRLDTTSATNSPTAPTLLQLNKAVYANAHKGSRTQAAWYFNPMSWANTIGQASSAVPTFTATWGAPLPQAPLSDGTLLSYPVYVTNQITTATEGAPAFFGSFGTSMIFGDRTGIDFMVSEHEKFQYGLLAMRVIKRTGIVVVSPHAFTLLGKLPYS